MNMAWVIPSEDRELLYALSSEIREKILNFVSQRPMKITELARKIKVSATTIVENVDILEKAGLVKTEFVQTAPGKPRMVTPTERIFAEGLRIPSLNDVPFYSKARELIDAYRKEVLSGGLDPRALRWLVQRLFDLSWDETEKFTPREIMGKMQKFLGVDRISSIVWQWIKLKYDDWVSKKDRQPYTSPSVVREYDFDYNPITGRGPSIQEMRKWERRGVIRWGRPSAWITQIEGVLFRCTKLLIFYDKKVLLQDAPWALSWSQPAGKLPYLDLSYINIEIKLRKSEVPFAKVALEVLEEIRTQIPQPDPTIFGALWRTYFECLETLKKTREKAIPEKKKCERTVAGPFRGFTRKRTVDYLQDLEFIERETERCFELIRDVEKELGVFAEKQGGDESA